MKVNLPVCFLIDNNRVDILNFYIVQTISGKMIYEVSFLYNNLIYFGRLDKHDISSASTFKFAIKSTIEETDRVTKMLQGFKNDDNF